MHFHVAAPPPELAPWIVSGMHVGFDGTGSEPVPCHFPALVEGGFTVVLEGAFLLQAGDGCLVPLPTGFVSGASAQPLTLYRTPRLSCVGLRLQPAGTQVLLQASPGALADADDVFGSAWGGLLDRLLGTQDAARRLVLLFAFARTRLLRQCVHAERVQRALRLQHAALQHAAPQDAVGLGVRQFERVFTSTFGLRPKLFQRVARVEGVLRDALQGGSTDAQLALRHGYYDQSHLARDLRSLVGTPLRELVQAVRRPGTEHWPLAVGTAPRMSLFS